MDWACTVALLASLVPGCAPTVAVYGYVEGEYVAMAPLEVARIAAVTVKRGDRVEAGAPIATMEASDATLAVADARARLAQAESELADLRRGRRPEEIEVIAAGLQSAETQVADTERALARRRDLFNRGFAAQAELDQALTARDVAAARVRETAANLAVARLPARDDAIRASESRVAQARTALATAEWRLSERSLTAKVAGRITDLVRRPGEVAGPQAAVATLLPDGAVKVKLWVPERLFSRFALGDEITVGCDGCGPEMRARITYVAAEPEFTPPVIYSVETRQKLVHLVEARPIGAGTRLQPGQIVDVRVPEGRR
ncbi:HlyD family efflux transporter periplasmic adaptor subunit [Siculibacillus lacustris]|uniref:HlyD family efflux transporter periplasmic adaptor subunit n=1 Tax=Siculibacillus lacustris TaxID=1549641 RepID=A0A4Q9VN53_9HYPH|nr:HlyD family efflux transporter periplasmic adaptor subunit [Siculibacillus lacustris]